MPGVGRWCSSPVSEPRHRAHSRVIVHINRPSRARFVLFSPWSSRTSRSCARRTAADRGQWTIAVKRQEVRQWFRLARYETSGGARRVGDWGTAPRAPRSARSWRGPRATARVDRRATTTPNLTVPSHYRAATANAPTPRRGKTGRVQLSPRRPADVGKPATSVTLSRVFGLGPPHPSPGKE